MPIEHASRGVADLTIALPPLLPCSFVRPAHAHELPVDARFHVWVKPGGGRLEVLVRAPLEAMRDVDLLLRGDYLIVSKADRGIAHAARIWIADRIEARADGRPLGPPRLVATRVALASDRAFAAFETARDGVLVAELAASCRRRLADRRGHGGAGDRPRRLRAARLVARWMAGAPPAPRDAARHGGTARV